MSPEQVIKAALEELEALKGKIYPLEGVKGAQTPYAIYFRRGEDEEEALDGATGLLSGGFEVHVVTRSYSQLVSLGRQVRTRLRALQGQEREGLLIERCLVKQSTPDLFEPEVIRYSRGYTLTMNYQEEE